MIARLEQLLGRLPKSQRDLAQRKLQQAVAWGWDADEISLTTPDGAEPHHCELIGVHPVSGEKTLLPEAE